MNVGNDRKLGLLFIGLAIIFCLGIAIIFAGPQVTIPMSVVVWPSLSFLVGVMLICSDILERKWEIDDEIHEFGELVQDDLLALRSGRITLTHVKILATVICSFIFFWQVVEYQKWYATWQLLVPVSVLVLTLGVMVLVWWFGLQFDWFQYRRDTTPWWLFVIPVAGFFLCVLLGTYFNEPVQELDGLTRNQITASNYEENYRWEHSRGSRVVIFNQIYSYSGGNGGSVNFSMPSCTGKNCGYFYVAVLFILLVILLVLGSVFFPHFWVPASGLLLAILALIALRDLLFRDHRKI